MFADPGAMLHVARLVPVPRPTLFLCYGDILRHDAAWCARALEGFGR